MRQKSQNNWSLYSNRSLLINVTSVFTLMPLDGICVSSRLIWSSNLSCCFLPPRTCTSWPQRVPLSMPVSSIRVKVLQALPPTLLRLRMYSEQVSLLWSWSFMFLKLLRVGPWYVLLTSPFNSGLRLGKHELTTPIVGSVAVQIPAFT